VQEIILRNELAMQVALQIESYTYTLVEVAGIQAVCAALTTTERIGHAFART
jgi:hypothetical protein